MHNDINPLKKKGVKSFHESNNFLLTIKEECKNGNSRDKNNIY